MIAQIKSERSRYADWVTIIATFLLLACLLVLTTTVSRQGGLVGPRHAVVGSGAMASLNWGSPSC